MKAAIILQIINILLISEANSQKIVSPLIRRDGGCYSSSEVHQIGRELALEALQLQYVPNCGDGLWKRVFSLNMTNIIENCPPGWDVRTNPRSCTQTTAPGCSLVNISSETVYQKVCGRALGFANGTNDAFMNWTSARNGFNYVDGINLFLATATPLHVWTFAVDQRYYGPPRCPCSSHNNHPFPDYVGQNYFCDTHEASNVLVWDGEGCAAEACCDYNNPPWFHRTLNTTYGSNLQVRICSDEEFSNERVQLIELELYVQ